MENAYSSSPQVRTGGLVRRIFSHLYGETPTFAVLGRNYERCCEVLGAQASIAVIAYNEDDELIEPKPVSQLEGGNIVAWCPPYEGAWAPGGLMTTWFALVKAGVRDGFEFHESCLSANVDGWLMPTFPAGYPDENAERIDRCFAAMADEASRETFIGALTARMKGCSGYIPIAEYPQYYHPEMPLRPGEVVYEGGVETGHSTEQMLGIVGEEGEVFAFEPISQFCDELKVRLGDPSNLHLVNAGLWSKVTTSTISSAGGGSRVGESGEQCDLISIDSFVQSHKPPTRIKLDIESAEMPTLIGAEDTIRRFRPNLMVAVYHHPVVQFLDIIDWLVELDVGYRFWLGHHSPLAYETVIYASAD